MIIRLMLILLCTHLSVFAFKFNDFAEAVAGEVVKNALNGTAEDSKKANNSSSTSQQVTSQHQAAEATKQQQEEARLKAEEEARLKAEEEARLVNQNNEFDDSKQRILAIQSSLPDLKAKAADQDTLSFKGFYPGMSLLDAAALVTYYRNDRLGDIQEAKRFLICQPGEATPSGTKMENFTITQVGKEDFNPADDSTWEIQYGELVLVRSIKNKQSYAIDATGTIKSPGKLAYLFLHGKDVDHIWGVGSLSGEKFAELFVENYFAKSLGDAWSSFIDQSVENDDDYNTIYVWENTKKGYRLKLHTSGKHIELFAIKKEADLSFD